MNPVIIIPARLASTRLPEKPLADICGEPMIVHVWRRAMESGAGPVYVACDDVRIERVIREAGGRGIMTRADHPSGSDRIYEALQNIDPQKHYDVVINVQGDVPTIDPALIRAVLEPLNDPAVDIATLACEIKDPYERTDPSVVKVAGSWQLAEKTALQTANCKLQTCPGGQAFSFTRTPKDEGTLYHHIGIYAYRRAALERFVHLPPSASEQREKLEQLRALDAGMRIDAALVDTVPLGVDTQEQLERARRALGIRL